MIIFNVITPFRKGDAVTKNLPKSFALGEVDLTKSKTKGAAMQSIAVEGADYRKVVGKVGF